MHAFMTRWCVVVLSCAIALGCKRDRDEATATAEQSTNAKPKGGFPYATSRSSVPLEKKGRELWIARDGVRLAEKEKPIATIEGESIALEFKRKGPTDLYIVPIATALAEDEEKSMEHVAILHVDIAVSYRTLVEVLFTLGQIKYARWQFVVKNEQGSLAAIPLEAPSGKKAAHPSSSAAKALAAELEALEMKALGSLGASSVLKGPIASASVPPPPPSPKCGDLPLGLSAIVTSDGILVKAFGVSLGPDCLTPKSGTTIARNDGRHDFAGLTACVTKILARSPAYASEQGAMMSAQPATDFQTVVSTWDALRKRADGTALLPDLALTILR